LVASLEEFYFPARLENGKFISESAKAGILRECGKPNWENPSNFDADMYTLRAYLFICATMIVANHLEGQDYPRTPEQVKAIRDFRIEGVGLKTTRDEFLAMFKEAELEKENSTIKLGIEIYKVARTRETDGIRFKFLDGKLVKILASYSPSRIKAIGGDSIIPEKLTLRFGKSESDNSGGSYGWSSGGESPIFVVTTLTDNGDTAVCLQNLKLEEIAKARKATAAKVGF
jgi:hypothetical protein